MITIDNKFKVGDTVFFHDLTFEYKIISINIDVTKNGACVKYCIAKNSTDPRILLVDEKKLQHEMPKLEYHDNTL
jgi:hypothetical protein